jgi:hypothetical protein
MCAAAVRTGMRAGRARRSLSPRAFWQRAFSDLVQPGCAATIRSRCRDTPLLLLSGIRQSVQRHYPSRALVRHGVLGRGDQPASQPARPAVFAGGLASRLGCDREGPLCACAGPQGVTCGRLLSGSEFRYCALISAIFNYSRDGSRCASPASSCISNTASNAAVLA